MPAIARKPTLNPALREFWKTPGIRNRVLHGGRDSTKSWDAAGFAIFLAQKVKMRFLCTRQFQNKISESVYTLLKIQIDRFGLRDQFEITNTMIRNKHTGTEFLFYGLWRHIDEIKSLESIDICWIEEAHNLTKEQWAILEPTLRSNSSQFWIIFNPRFATDFVYKRFVTNPPPDTLVRQINYLENQFISKTSLKIINALKEEDYEEYQHRYLGVPKDSDEGSVIKRAHIMAAIDAHLTVVPSEGEWRGGKTVGYDVADDGDDKNATTSMDGSVCIHLDEWKGGEDELFESATRVRNTALIMDASSIGYDSIGVGAGTGSHLNNQTPPWKNHFKFNAGGKVADPKRKYKDTQIKNIDFFANLKAQKWWDEADRFRNTYLAVTKGKEFPADEMVSLSSECDSRLLEQMIDELSIPKKDFDKYGKVKVESKKDLAKRDVDSPNIADSYIIANSRGLVARRKIHIG